MGMSREVAHMAARREVARMGRSLEVARMGKSLEIAHMVAAADLIRSDLPHEPSRCSHHQRIPSRKLS